MKKTIAMKLLLVLMIIFSSQSDIHAQQLIKTIKKNWKIHTGVFGGVGASNFLQSSASSMMTPPEGYTNTSLLYAPRPEARIGVFSEVESSCKFSFRIGAAYMMRAIPKPSFNNAAQTAKKYESIYLNGFMTDLTVFFNATSKFKFGIGFESTHFLMTKKLKEGVNAEYAQQYGFTHGVKTVVGYTINPRTEVNMFVLASNNTFDIGKVNNISGGVNIAYRLCGKEIRLQKDIYKIDYAK